MSIHVLHLNTWNNIGGAGRAAHRLHLGLIRNGVDSRMLVGRETEPEPQIALLRNPKRDLWDRFLYRTGLQNLFYSSSLRFPNHKWARESNIINFHNVHGEPGLFAYTALPRLSRAKRVVWTLHDMWALTGHCAYSFECNKWKSGCGACPYLHEYPELVLDSTRLLWHIKRFSYSRSHITFVSPSKWLTSIARASPLIGRFNIHTIPNGVDSTIFKPTPKNDTRRKLDLPTDRAIIFWGVDESQDYRKGGDYLDRLTDRLGGGTSPITIVQLQRSPEIRKVGNVQIINREVVADEARMAEYFAAADIFVLPTRADNLPNTILESMACGTPVVAFNVGGVAEAVGHTETGYIAQANDLDDLLAGVCLLLDNPGLTDKLGDRARSIAHSEFDIDIQTKRYIELYETLLAEPDTN